MNAYIARLAVPLARAAAALLLALASPGVAAADDDLPGRVGRLADLGGGVYVSARDQAEDWVEALRNYTVTSGDNLWVTDDGHAEVDYGGGQFRLSGDTNVHIARLDDRMLALFVAHGRVIVRVRVLDAGEAARVDTPNTQLSLTRPGLYRIDVSEDRDHTTLVVREGEGTVSVAGGVQQVLPGQGATVSGAEPAYAQVRSGYRLDGFDTWSAERDRRYERSRSASYVSRQMIGYADLDDHGRWDSSPEYGAIWYPTTVSADWAPYRHGRWSSVGDFGWTWVDDAPWGYAPFHYGRWVFVGNRWGWCPGEYIARPAWAPALVGWYGGSGWSASVSFGAPVYGWVPLGWGEPYRPSWRNCSDRCWARYNRPYAVNRAERSSAPPTRYRNWNAPGGVTAVAGATFTGRQPVHANLVSVRPQSVANAPMLSRAPVLAKPTANSIPGAKPTIAAPPPAAQFYRTKPLQVAPGRVAPSGVARPGSTWGESGAPLPRANTPAPVASPGATYSDPPSRARPVAPAPAVSAPPAMRSYPRPAQANSAAPGTWGTPSSPAPRAVIPSRPESRVPQGGIVNRAEPRPMPSAPAASVPMPRSAPPAVYAPPAQAVRPVPSAAPAPSPSAAPSVPVAPQPRGMQSAPPAAKPVPQRNGDKPTVQR